MSTSTSATVTVETLPVLHYQSQRVVTTELLAQLYGTDVKNIQMNFANNEGRFEPGKHFHKLTGAELREFKSRPNPIGSVKIARNGAGRGNLKIGVLPTSVPGTLGRPAVKSAPPMPATPRRPAGRSRASGPGTPPRSPACPGI